MKQIRIALLVAVAPLKKPGYLEACRAVGKPIRMGTWLELTDEDYHRIGLQYATEAAPQARPPIGLGDLVHKVAGPVGRAVRWPCMKKNGTTDLKPGSPCARARRLLNQIKI